jgi:putative membrane protein
MKQLAIALAILFAAAACRERAGQTPTDTTGAVQTASDTATASATTTGSTGGTSSNMTGEDKDFVSKAAMGSLTEVLMGNLALQKAASADVKALAQRMVDDHSKTLEELRQMALTKGLGLPTEMAGDHKKAFDHLESLSGAEFDKAYASHMVEDHEKDVAEFDKASTSATDSDVKTWAGKTLPTLKEHLALAKDIARKV